MLKLVKVVPMINDFLNPNLSLAMQALIRMSYGLCLISFLIMVLPHRKRFFLSRRWKGYAQDSSAVEVLHRPYIYQLIFLIWLNCAILITSGYLSVWAAFINLLICRYYFVHMRWKGLARGLGAPGFMTYWLAGVVFLMEYTIFYAPELRQLALLVLQVDFAFIMLSSGIYKITAGYPQNHGLEYGLINPQWCYWWRFYQPFPARHWWYIFQNQCSWSLQTLAAVLMFIPPLRFWGGALIIFSFLFVLTQIRLGVLCQMVMIGGFLFFHPDSYGELALQSILPLLPLSYSPPLAISPFINACLASLLWCYLLLLPLTHLGLSYNFYLKKRFPPLIQKWFERYTNFFGLIVWRVFTVNLVNFFIRIYHESKETGERTLYSKFGLFEGGFRYSHVCESITLTTLFTTLKYYPDDREKFESNLMAYARTLPCSKEEVLIFKYLSISKQENQMQTRAVVEYTLDPHQQTLEETQLVKNFNISQAHQHSSTHRGSKPGSYAPKIEN